MYVIIAGTSARDTPRRSMACGICVLSTQASSAYIAAAPLRDWRRRWMLPVWFGFKAASDTAAANPPRKPDRKTKKKRKKISKRLKTYTHIRKLENVTVFILQLGNILSYSSSFEKEPTSVCHVDQ